MASSMSGSRGPGTCIKQGADRGIEFCIDIDARFFENGDGDIHLFGLVLNRFLAQYVTINSSVMLKFVDTKTSKEYEWDANPGRYFSLMLDLPENAPSYSVFYAIHICETMLRKRRPYVAWDMLEQHG